MLVEWAVSTRAVVKQMKSVTSVASKVCGARGCARSLSLLTVSSCLGSTLFGYKRFNEGDTRLRRALVRSKPCGMTDQGDLAHCSSSVCEWYWLQVDH